MRINVRFDSPLVVVSPGLSAIADALNRIADAMEPHGPTKATAVSMSNIQAESLTPPSEVPMAQFKIGLEGCRATLVFNGKIDGEPALAVVGGTATMNVDPKVEVPTADTTDPDHFVDTHVTLHFRNTGSLLAGVFGVLGSAIADDPETPAEENIVIDFPEVGEYIPQTQAKANSVSLATESEPL